MPKFYIIPWKIFSRFFFWGGGLCPPAPISYAYGFVCLCAVKKLLLLLPFYSITLSNFRNFWQGCRKFATRGCMVSPPNKLCAAALPCKNSSTTLCLLLLTRSKCEVSEDPVPITGKWNNANYSTSFTQPWRQLHHLSQISWCLVVHVTVMQCLKPKTLSATIAITFKPQLGLCIKRHFTKNIANLKSSAFWDSAQQWIWRKLCSSFYNHGNVVTQSVLSGLTEYMYLTML